MTQIALLPERRLIEVKGPDARPFLHNLLSQDIETLTPGVLRYGALLTPPGRLLYDLFVLGTDDGVVLDAPAANADDLLRRLTMYRLRAKVEIAASGLSVHAVWDGEAAAALPDPRVPGLGSRLYGEANANATEADWRVHCLALGVADPAIDAPADTTYPIEANLDLLNAIDFHKGCFVGQETTSRMKRRGTIKNRMLTLTFDGPPPPFGAEVLLNGDRRAGEVRGGIDGMATALLRLDRIDGELTVDGRPVSVLRPAWLPAALPTDPAG